MGIFSKLSKLFSSNDDETSRQDVNDDLINFIEGNKTVVMDGQAINIQQETPPIIKTQVTAEIQENQIPENNIQEPAEITYGDAAPMQEEQQEAVENGQENSDDEPTKETSEETIKVEEITETTEPIDEQTSEPIDEQTNDVAVVQPFEQESKQEETQTQIYNQQVDTLSNALEILTAHNWEKSNINFEHNHQVCNKIYETKWLAANMSATCDAYTAYNNGFSVCTYTFNARPILPDGILLIDNCGMAFYKDLISLGRTVKLKDGQKYILVKHSDNPGDSIWTTNWSVNII